jgi:calcium-dependent protein kinase
MDNHNHQLLKDKNNMVLSRVHAALLAGRLKAGKTAGTEESQVTQAYSSSEISSSSSMSDEGDVRCQNPADLLVRLGDYAPTKDDASSSGATSGSFCPSRMPLVRFHNSCVPSSEPSLTMEVDSQDERPARGPLHIVGVLEDLPPATRKANALPIPVTPRKPKLTLSAFRRPEEAIRLTDCDPSRLLENEYHLRAPGCRVIGHGAFSTVRLAFRKYDGEKVAVKSLSKFDALRARRLRKGGINSERDHKHMDEWEIMKLLQGNPHVLALFDVFETDDEIHLVTEYCRGGELFDAIKRKGAKRSSFRRGRYSEAQAARITHQVLRALLDLHDSGIVHRDVKAENILLLSDDESDIQVKLADFGMARLHSMDPNCTEGESSPSTPGLVYSTCSPPEVRCTGALGPSVDVFSLGVTLYTLLCGFPPVFCDGLVEFPEAYWCDISDEAKAVVRAMVHPDPSMRITVRSALSNPWVRQQTTRVRRGSISANLELVRSRLYKTMGDAVSPSLKKQRRGSLTTLSPKKQRRLATQLSISMTDLYAVSAKDDVRVIHNHVEPAAIDLDGGLSEQ